MSYYYLAAQLPSLIYGGETPMSSASFRDLAASSMPGEDAALLDCCVLDPEPAGAGEKADFAENAPSTGCDFIDRWRVWERALRLNLARLRFQKAPREGGAALDPPPHPADAAAAAKAACALESPLEAEIFLDKARWNAIESFQGIQYFSRNTIYAYLLKLRLCERRLKFSGEKGFAEYKELYAAIMNGTSKGGASAEAVNQGVSK